jgi:hypothetical protein
VLFSGLIARWSRSRLLRVKPDAATEDEKADYDAYPWWVIPALYSVPLLIASFIGYYQLARTDEFLRIMVDFIGPFITGINLFLLLVNEDLRWRTVHRNKRNAKNIKE